MKMKKCISGILSLLLVLSLLAGPAYAADGGGQKSASTNAIAIVFDNSGSMYASGSMAWCQATYAMEVFAAMMNSGDTLQIYPMNEIDLNGTPYSSDSPLIINGTADAARIQDIFTHGVGLTPIESLPVAHDGLLRTQADQRWLIVLTDGNTFWENGAEISAEETRDHLSQLLGQYSQDVNVLYLGIGDMQKPEFASSTGYITRADTVTSAGVPAKLSELCNLIFGRDELPQENMGGGQLQFDIPMRKLIVFVQGDSVGDIALTAPDGSVVGAVSSYAPHYSTKGTGGYTSVPDTTLQGVIVTYGECPAGAYGLSYSGTASSVVAYYEPDVDLAVYLADETGARVDLNGDVHPGQYDLMYGIADRSGNLLDSALLGNTFYDIAFTVNGNTQPITADRSGSQAIELADGDTVDVSAAVTFLSGYQIVKDGAMLGWPAGGLSVAPWPVGTLSMDVSGGSDTYDLFSLEDQAHYDVALRYDGQLLTPEQMDRTEMQAGLSGGNATYDLVRTDGGYALDIGYAEDVGSTESGDYTVTLSASYVDENQQTSAAEQTIGFTIQEQTSALRAELDAPEDYYVISKLDEAEPLMVTLTKDGAPLTAEQMALTTLTAESEGLQLHTEMLPDQSAWEIAIAPDGGYDAGRYEIAVTASTQDELGREISANASTDVTLQHFPIWVWYLGGLLLLLLLLLLIWLYMNMKVLPKLIRVADCRFSVNGHRVDGIANCSFDGGKKHSGTLTVVSPPYGANPMAKAGFTLQLQGCDPRRKRSSSRGARVRGVSAMNAASTNTLRVSAFQLVKNPTTKKLSQPGAAGAEKPIDFRIVNGTNCSVSATVMNPKGGRSNVNLSVTLRFY